ELGAVEPAAGRELPLRFGRQVLARPFRVSQGVAVGDVNDGMIIEATERAARSVGSPPVGSKFERPPLAPVAHIIDRMVLWIRGDLGEGDMAGRPDELAEFAICNRSAINPEGVDSHPMDRRLFRVMLVRPHAEGAAGNPNHFGVARARTINVMVS